MTANPPERAILPRAGGRGIGQLCQFQPQINTDRHGYSLISIYRHIRVHRACIGGYVTRPLRAPQQRERGEIRGTPGRGSRFGGKWPESGRITKRTQSRAKRVGRRVCRRKFMDWLCCRLAKLEQERASGVTANPLERAILPKRRSFRGRGSRNSAAACWGRGGAEVARAQYGSLKVGNIEIFRALRDRPLRCLPQEHGE